MKIVNWFKDNILFVCSLFLLVFIPLYPKLPILDIEHTWVYIRIEDFAVALTLGIWTYLFFRKKVTLKTPLTLPILLFWIVGGLATIHGVLLIFPTESNLFSNVAFLSLFRRIEYLSLFFVAYSAMRGKRFIPAVSLVLATTLLAVVAYGLGQKYLGFPAFLTMNEEFAKGVPIQLSSLSRVPSTFGGQYDLAAYLVLVVPILVSMAFGFRNKLMKIFLLISTTMGFGLIFMTVSRVSLFVLLLSLVMLLVIQRKKIILASLFIITLAFLSFSPQLLARFGSTVSEIDVLVNAETGDPIGQVKEVPASYFENKIIAKSNASDADIKAASSTAIFPLKDVPPLAQIVIEPNAPNGESLPQGTSYINLPLSPITKRTGQYFYEKSKDRVSSDSAQAYVYFGDFVIKRAKAYDLSFTTRFQGEWPHTLKAFERNILLGSGYGSVSLAVDNDYLRLLGETGLLGFVSFLSIILVAIIYILKAFPKVEDRLEKSFFLGFFAGTFGLALNAIFIDVFEASKIAFVYWLLMGIALGILKNYSIEEIEILREVKKVLTSTVAIVVYLFALSFSLFSSTFSNYFVGDDFTWFRWVSDCINCQPFSQLISYFTNSQGFFYRPGAKLYFSSMYSLFWLNQTMYHVVSTLLHFLVVILIFYISKKIFKNNLFAFLSAVSFLFLSSHFEATLWVSATGFLFTGFFALLAIVTYSFWKEKNKKIFLAFSIISVVLSMIFHELGVVTPFLVILYDTIFMQDVKIKFLRKDYYLLILPLLPYFVLRLISSSHWFNGDYSYNLVKFPLNFVGNTIGYSGLILLGPSFISVYEKLRILARGYPLVSLVICFGVIYVIFYLYRYMLKNLTREEVKIVIFAVLFLVISLIPFLGLGNITSRYSYLASFGFVLLFVFFLKKLYEYLLSNGSQIAKMFVLLIFIIFSAMHLFQLQKIQGDWESAGEKSVTFLNSADYIYAHYPQEERSSLYFVDVPIQNGDAWVFPVGLKDAMWFVFQDKNLKIFQVSSVEQAFNIKGEGLGKVFKFTPIGSLIEYRKNINGEIFEVKE